MIFNMNFELRNELANFGTKFEIFWQKLCEIDCNTYTKIRKAVFSQINENVDFAPQGINLNDRPRVNLVIFDTIFSNIVSVARLSSTVGRLSSCGISD